MGVAGALFLVALSLPAAARGGGTLVIAPKDLSESDCRPGAPTRFEGFDAGAFAMGCVYPRANRGVLLAGDLGGSFACFYIVPAGSSNEGPCAQVGPKHQEESSSPLTGLRGLVPLTVGGYGDDAYLAGWASDGVPSVTTEFSAPSGASIDEEAELLRVPASQQEALGAAPPSRSSWRGSPTASIRAEGSRCPRQAAPGPRTASASAGRTAHTRPNLSHFQALGRATSPQPRRP